jgi:hypothetical protein
MPVTTPVAGSTVATPVALLLHVPPDDASVSVVVIPIHTVLLPPMDTGAATTVTATLAPAAQPVEYVMFATPPPVPVTTPPAVTVAILVLSEFQLPPVLASVNVVVALTQMLPPPVTGAGVAYTVVVAVAALPHPFAYVIVTTP